MDSGATLVKLEELDRRVLDILPVGVLVRDPGGAAVYANQECRRLLGEDVIEPGGDGRPLVVAGTAQPYPDERDPCSRGLLGEASRVTDMEVLTPDGRVPLVVSGTPLRGPDGRLTHLLLTYADVGAAQAGPGTALAQATFAGLFDQVLHSVALLDADGTMLEANRRPFELTGWRREDAIGHPFWETPWWRGSPALQARVRESVRRAAAGEAIVEESEYHVASGPPRVTLRALNPVRDAEGNVRHILVVAHDVTELRHAEHEASQLAAIVEGAVDFIALTDARERVRYLNPAGRVMVGMHARAPLPGTFSELLTEDGLWQLRDEAEPALAQTGTWRGETQLRHFGGGDPIDVFMTAMVLPDPPDDDAGVAFVCQDIRERRRIEAALAKALDR